MEKFVQVPHRRFNALNGEWVFVSPHRTQRPWLGREEGGDEEEKVSYDPGCYLCPGNERAGGHRNPVYKDTFVFTNDFAALLPEVTGEVHQPHQLILEAAVPGTCRVICFSPDHGLTLAEMTKKDILKVIDTWSKEVEVLGKKYRWVQVFENKGEIMGCSNPHPHCQIWAGDFLPNEPMKEDNRQREHFLKENRPLLMDYLELELKEKKRMVYENDHWVALVPFWATWPFEALVLPKHHVLRFPDLNGVQRKGLADMLKNLLARYDNLFRTSFPYTMGWHGAPFDAGNFDHWQLHAHFYPPLLRSATVKKFMVGFEMMAEAQRDITAETAAETLRKQPGIHYKQTK